MRSSVKSKLLVASCLLLPAIVTQRLRPLLDDHSIKEVASSALLQLSCLGGKNPERPSDVAVIEVDDDTIYAQLEECARSAGKATVHADDFSMLLLRRVA